jgi:hypothetical protein
MRQIPILRVVVLLAVFLLVGCACSSCSAWEPPPPPHQSSSTKFELHPEGDSGVSGTAAIDDISEGVIVKLALRDLPKPNTLYLAHIHPGTCSQEEQEGEAHEHEYGEHHEEEGHVHEHGEEIEYPLSQVKSNSEGRGTSTTTLHDTSFEKFFSGEPKHVNVHEAGTGNPPVLACADLKR